VDVGAGTLTIEPRPEVGRLRVDLALERDVDAGFVSILRARRRSEREDDKGGEEGGGRPRSPGLVLMKPPVRASSRAK
jgi:hypothetical protein